MKLIKYMQTTVVVEFETALASAKDSYISLPS
jgi:hypothetical protein